MIQVLTPNDYTFLCNEISKIETQPKLHGYLDSLGAMYEPTHPLFWLLLHNELGTMDNYDTEEDIQNVWIECKIEAPELSHYSSAPNPAIRYAKVYSAFKEYEADINSLKSDEIFKPKGYARKLTSFSSSLSLEDQLEMRLHLLQNEFIAKINEEDFLAIFSNQLQEKIKTKIKWIPNKGGKYYNESLFIFLHKMCANEYDNLSLKKEYFFKILENFDLTANGNKSQPQWEALKSAYSKWKGRVFIKRNSQSINTDNLDVVSQEIYDFEATNLKQLSEV